MKAIGGFFELELPGCRANCYHPAATALSTGRACLTLILQTEQPRRIYVPYYTCDSLLVPMQEKNIEYVFYSINAQLEIQALPTLQSDELLIYINFFGIKHAYSHQLRAILGRQLIIDNTHAFFSIEDPGQGWAYNSARKFFGVPDGAYLYGLSSAVSMEANDTICVNHLVDRLIGKQESAYAEFIEYENNIDNSITGISVLSEKLLLQVDYCACIQQRLHNFAQYHKAFAQINELSVRLDGLQETPSFCYPLLLPNGLNRERLFDQNIFIPWLWREALNRSSEGYEIEKYFASNILPLPVDHRYSQVEIAIVIKAISDLILPTKSFVL